MAKTKKIDRICDGCHKNSRDGLNLINLSNGRGTGLFCGLCAVRLNKAGNNRKLVAVLKEFKDENTAAEVIDIEDI